MCRKIFAVVLYLIPALVWYGLLKLSFLVITFDSFWQDFGNGILIFIFAALNAAVFVLPILFGKKLPACWMTPAAMLVLAIAACISCFGIRFAAESYVSNFNRRIWDTNAELRIYMIEDLERNHPVIGKTEQEIKDLLGDPTNISEHRDRTFEYFINSGYVDPITYDIRFENGIAVSSQKVHH